MLNTEQQGSHLPMCVHMLVYSKYQTGLVTSSLDIIGSPFTYYYSDGNAKATHSSTNYNFVETSNIIQLYHTYHTLLLQLLQTQMEFVLQRNGSNSRTGTAQLYNLYIHVMFCIVAVKQEALLSLQSSIICFLCVHKQQ